MKKFVRSLAAVLSAVLLMGTVTGCSSSVSMEDYSTTVAATYGDEEIYLDEVNFFLRYLQWYQEESYWEIYETYFGYEDMWEADSGNGSMTLGEYLKEVVMAQALQTRILLDHTEDYDIELTDEDVELAEEAVAELRDSFAEEFTNYSDASDEDILGWFEENLLANKVYEAVRQSTEVEVTDEECQMFTLQYVYVSETDEDEDTEDEDEDTDSDEDTEDEDELINEDLAEAVLACLEAGEDFDSIEDALGVSYSEASYLIAETEDDSELFAYGSEMSTGESVMFESESGGWYVIYCVSDLDEEATEEQRAEVEDELREEYFEEVYAEWAEEAPEFTVNKVWNQIVVGGGKIYVAKEDEEEDETEASEDEAEDESEEETEEEAEEETTEEAAEDETSVTEETEETTAAETETETSEETSAEETTEESTAVETEAGETTAAE